MMPALIAIALMAVFLYLIPSLGGSQSQSTACNNNPCYTGGCMCAACSTITNDPMTWPSGDRIWLVCHAIALAEGANNSGSVPDNLNNPGDISDGYSEFGGEFHSGSSVTHFPDKNTGWQWLYNKISNAASGKSSTYFPTDTWNSFARKWAGDWKNWVTNVTNVLGVDPNSTLSDFMNS
jgi:hypothetical protein